MQRNRTCPICGAQIEEDPPAAGGRCGRPPAGECLVILGPPLVEHRSRDYFGRPVGVVGIDDLGIPAVDD